MNDKRNIEVEWRWPWLDLIAVTIVFSAIAYFFYDSIILNLNQGLDHLGDPALTAWILSWDLHAFLSNPMDIFHSNMFYPYSNTLAYSENLIFPSLLLLPVYAFTSNPVILYNVSFLTGVILSGVCAYLLAYYLTRSRPLSLMPGIALAFSPFMLAHHGHLQMHFAYLIPLLFLFLYLYFDRLNAGRKGRRLYLFAAALCLLLQFLSNTYYFIYLSTCAGLFQLYRILRTRKDARKTAMMEMACFWLIAGLLTLPFALPYLSVREQLGFDRSIDEVKYFSADVVNYLAYNGGNVWFGDISGEWAAHQSEKYLSPGITLAILALFPLLLKLGKFKDFKEKWRDYRRLPHVFHVIDGLIILSLSLLLYILSGHDLIWLGNGEVVKLLGVKMKMTRPENTFLYMLAMLLLRGILKFRREGLPRIDISSENIFYTALVIFAFLMSLGPRIHFSGEYISPGLYKLFYNFVPGYGGLRVPARFGVMVVFGISILAVLNIQGILNRIHFRPARFLMAGILPLLLIAEFYTPPPGPMRYRPYEREVDAWLRDAPPGNAMELPLSASPKYYAGDIRAVFQSIYHWKPIFNGYSGYSPPIYYPAAFYMQTFPSKLSARIINLLGIDYVVVRNPSPAIIAEASPYFDLLKDFGDDAVLTPHEIPALPNDTIVEDAAVLEKSKWKITLTAPQGVGDYELLQDGRGDTCWHTRGPQEAGNSIEFEMKEPVAIAGMRLYFGSHPERFPRGMSLQAWSEGSGWEDIEYSYDPVQFISSIILESPHNAHMRLSFKTTATRLRIVLNETLPILCFGVADIEILTLR